jgi:hypothetical protein
MNKFLFVFFILFAQFFSSCTDEKAINLGNINKFSISGLNNGTLVCSADLEIENRSFFSFQLETAEMIVLAGETKIGVVHLLKPIVIPGHSSKKYNVDFSVEVDNPEAGLISAFSDVFGNKTVFRLKGSIIAKSFLFSRKIFIDKLLGVE